MDRDRDMRDDRDRGLGRDDRDRGLGRDDRDRDLRRDDRDRGLGRDEPVDDRRRRGSGWGIAALVLGILSLPAILIPPLGVLLGVLAIIFGIVAAVRLSGRGLGIAGAVLGLLGALLSGLIIFGVMTVFEQSDIDCVRDAGGDQQAIEQCGQDVVDRVEQGAN